MKNEMLKVAVIDDEAGIRGLCREVLTSVDCEVVEAANLTDGEALLKSEQAALVFLDVRLPDGSGLDFFRKIHAARPEMKIAIMTGQASVEDAVEAVKDGALDYIAKPFDVERIKEIVQAVRKHMPALDNGKSFDFHGIIAASRPMREICETIRRAAQSISTVLIQGESGTGKELVAKAIHEAGVTTGQPFVPVDSGAIPHGLLESELFGHVKGAFTGAHTDSAGLFLSAGRGTVFLDEIGELPHSLQAKLLRALQEHEVRPVGATRPVPFSARVVVATNRDLRVAVADGEFRRDLFYRLHVIPIYLPPLRERRDDIPVLAQHFLDEFNELSGRSVVFSQAAVESLKRRDWAGNVRELQNCIERTFALTQDGVIDEADFGPSFVKAAPPRDGDRIEDYEKQAILSALEKAAGNRDKAAEILGIGVATLFRKIKKYNLK